MKEITIDQQWKRVQWIWYIYLGYTLLTTYIVLLHSSVSIGLLQVLLSLSFLIFLGGVIAAFAFKPGSDPAVLSHYSRQIYVFCVFSVLHIVSISIFVMILYAFQTGGYYLKDYLFWCVCVSIVIKFFLFAVSLFGVLRASNHIPISSTRMLTLYTLIIPVGIFSIILIAQPVGVSGTVLLGGCYYFWKKEKKRKEMKRKQNKSIIY
jgi:hypothetical protein